ncbi:hypothetical protein PSV08DRAFT_404671 [Bipolaris maydis]|uniref:uncharacterized protein n=1 Tax=Cochliobolus heterostrophus TaxID=5016 RepID=UPI0024D10982|nr:hypothetical protein J3E73DRAFT_426296 [Bipolaris maydis]KAJ5041485.1 hypothetical protein J3E74DRAFT_479361 [Bipolaris maydis]KAJ5055936.1 hypothetical protein J3E74DRAFT_477800 [Bipolaris maydis]KAJ6266896.1 hypothetical protein PSV08DRAFT_404671 [Bipolaris maydis]KAJ6277514.1 hypothetical protein J3E71DRAFT_402593 [Bipolaris maydis]
MGTQQAIIDASRCVSTANDDLEKSYQEMQALFQKIKDNRNAFESKIKPIDELFAAKRKELNDYIFQLGTDAAAITFVDVAAALAVEKRRLPSWSGESRRWALRKQSRGYSLPADFNLE